MIRKISTLTYFPVFSDFWVTRGLGLGVVGAWEDVDSLLQSMKIQGSNLSFGTPPKTKARDDMRTTVVFMI